MALRSNLVSGPRLPRQTLGPGLPRLQRAQPNLQLLGPQLAAPPRPTAIVAVRSERCTALGDHNSSLAPGGLPRQGTDRAWTGREMVPGGAGSARMPSPGG